MASNEVPPVVLGGEFYSGPPCPTPLPSARDTSQRIDVRDLVGGDSNLNLKRLHMEIFNTPGSKPLPLVQRVACSNPDSPPASAWTSWGPLHDAIALGMKSLTKPALGGPQAYPGIESMDTFCDEGSLGSISDSESSCDSESEATAQEALAHSASNASDTGPFDEVQGPSLMGRIELNGLRKDSSEWKDEKNDVPKSPDRKGVVEVASLETNISPRALAAITCEGRARDGCGILHRLESEIRRRAHEIWVQTNRPSEENWLVAEQSIIKAVTTPCKQIAQLEEIVNKKDVQIQEQAARIRELEIALEAKPQESTR